MAVGSFAIGTGEFAIMGLLPDVAHDIGVTIPQAGHVISTYALGVVVGAPVLAVATAGWRQRSLLVALMLFFALGNFASAMAPGYSWLAVLRLLAGLPHGTYFGVSALVAASLAPPGRRAQAVAQVMLGLTAATVVGVPLAAWLGQALGWRAAFAMVGCIALLAAVLAWRWIPDRPPLAGASAMRELGALARPQVWVTLGIGAIGFGGLFAVFSYVKPTLMEVAGVSEAAIPWALALLGMGMVVGNIVGAKLVDRALMPAIGGILVWSAAVLALFCLTAPHAPLAFANLFLVGTTIALGPALQVRLMDVAGDAQSLAAALNHSAFNFANALGAWLGGVAISAGLGWTSTGWVGALLALGGLPLFALALRSPTRATA
ncbi:MFS transporter [Xylophilus sp. GOD-11R]|uniref:MFS transporter n=1 Tax=Xylophilus sp. GOD-11R TaxID=3089814 RepID=UPI00298C7594|nr:MFS transporter [Xylophilus sp. GOD-11R]WPB59501.1 MFS transporter [Xylophilus sp. GOD-11R]